MKSAAAKKSAAPVLVPAFLTKVDGRTRLGRYLKVAPANDTRLEQLSTLDACYVAPALPEVRQVTAFPEPPCDARRVVDVIRAGWCTTAKTLSYGLCRAGIAPERIQAVIMAAMKSGLIECVRGVWVVSALAL